MKHRKAIGSLPALHRGKSVLFSKAFDDAGTVAEAGGQEAYDESDGESHFCELMVAVE